MRRRQLFLLVTLGLALAVLASVTHAATRTVPSYAYPTIQDAVDAANPGDTISIRPGLYKEFVTVTTPGLTIVGSYDPRRVIVDGSRADDGDGFDVDAPHTTIRNLTLRHYDGAGIDVDADHLTVSRVRFRNTDDGIDGDGDWLRVEECEFYGNTSSAMDFDGDDARIENNEAYFTDGFDIEGDRLAFRHNLLIQTEDDDCLDHDGDESVIEFNECNGTDDDGFDLDGDDLVVRVNIVTNTEDYGIYVDGHRAVIENNVVHHSYYVGIYVDGDDQVVRWNDVSGVKDDYCYEICGDDNLVEGNNASNCYDAGFDLYGRRFTVNENYVLHTLDYGIDISCPDNPCDEPSLVTNNQVTNNGEDSAGYYMSRIGDGSTIAGNRADYIFDYCFDVTMDDGLFESNRCTRSGADQESHFNIEGDRNRLYYNEASDTYGSCMEIDGDWNYAKGNVCRNNMIDGIIIDGDDNRLEYNLVEGNEGEGLQNEGLRTILIRNQSRDNRIDCAVGDEDPSSIAVNTSFCADGSNFLVEEQID